MFTSRAENVNIFRPGRDFFRPLHNTIMSVRVSRVLNLVHPLCVNVTVVFILAIDR